jgi:hypothetical protein
MNPYVIAYFKAAMITRWILTLSPLILSVTYTTINNRNSINNNNQR